MLPKHPDDSWHQGIDLGPALLAPFPLHPSFGPFPLDFDSFSARSPHSPARWLSIPVSFPSQPESRKNLERISKESRKNHGRILTEVDKVVDIFLPFLAVVCLEAEVERLGFHVVL